MKQLHALAVAASLASLAACNKAPSPISSVSSAASEVAQQAAAVNAGFTDLQRFKGAAPGDLLLKHEPVAEVVRSLVPQSSFKCLDQLLSYLPDLETNTDGSLTASLNGSHADKFMEGYASVSRSGRVDLVLQCEPQADPKGRYLYYTNGEMASAAPKGLLDWMYIVGRDGDVIQRSNGKAATDIAFSSFVSVLLAGAPKAAPEQTAALQSKQPPVSTASNAANNGSLRNAYVGEWKCQSRKQNGDSFSSAFKFTKDNGFAYVDPDAQMIGTYRIDGANLAVVIDQITNGGRVSNSSMQLRIGSLDSGPGHLKFDMTLVRLGTVIANHCVSKAVAAATPAPKVDVCAVNPAACGAVQRNHDIRSRMQDQRCEILRSQLSGTVGGDYQLSKAGCQ